MNSEKTVHYRYIYPNVFGNPDPIITIASLVDKIPSIRYNGAGNTFEIKYGISIRSHKDRYNKRLGMELALADMLKKNKLAYVDNMSNKEITLAILCNYYSLNLIPKEYENLIREKMYENLIREKLW